MIFSNLEKSGRKYRHKPIFVLSYFARFCKFTWRCYNTVNPCKQMSANLMEEVFKNWDKLWWMRMSVNLYWDVTE